MAAQNFLRTRDSEGEANPQLGAASRVGQMTSPGGLEVSEESGSAPEALAPAWQTEPCQGLLAKRDRGGGGKGHSQQLVWEIAARREWQTRRLTEDRSVPSFQCEERAGERAQSPEATGQGRHFLCASGSE